MENPIKLCDRNCNNCLLISHPNSRMISKILNQLYEKFGDKVGQIVNDNCPNLTVCYDCKIDDFCHVEGCEILDAAEKDCEKNKTNE